MTNGEKIKEIFPSTDSRLDEKTGIIWVDGVTKCFKVDWWNAEYKEPTTKNDLGVDCISRADVNRIICEYRDDAVMGDLKDVERAYGANAVGELIAELPSVYPKSDTQKINDLAEEAIKATGASDAYSHGMCNGIEYMRSVLTDTKPNFLDGEYKSNKSVLDDIKSELWIEGVNMVGEYQGVWVRFKDIEKAIDNHISKKEQQGEQE